MPIRWILAALLSLLAGCASAQRLPDVHEVNVSRFMGNWYVIAHIPTLLERNTYDVIEHYSLGENGEVDTTLYYRRNGLDQPVKTITSTAVVEPGTGNARWQVQLFWPLRFEYVVAYLDPNYQLAILARTKRNYAWIMARQPHLDNATYALLVGKLKDLGYDVSKLQRVSFPQAKSQPGPMPQHG